VESEAAFSLRRTQELELEELSRLFLGHILRRQLETKALVVRWIAGENAPQRTPRRDLIKPRANELTADALVLAFWRDRNRAQAKPRFRSVTQGDGGKSDLADQSVSVHSDKLNCPSSRNRLKRSCSSPPAYHHPHITTRIGTFPDIGSGNPTSMPVLPEQNMRTGFLGPDHGGGEGHAVRVEALVSAHRSPPSRRTLVARASMEETSLRLAGTTRVLDSFARFPN
jgi:hypothetical protein